MESTTICPLSIQDEEPRPAFPKRESVPSVVSQRGQFVHARGCSSGRGFRKCPFPHALSPWLALCFSARGGTSGT
jgi:hypothetical protein